MNALDLLDAVNVIDRLGGLILSLRHGGAHTFRFDRTTTTGADVERLLRRYKIRVFGRRITSKHAMLSVPSKQAAWAEYVLLRAGIVPDGPMLDPRNAAWAGRHAHGQAPPAWRDRKDGRR